MAIRTAEELRESVRMIIGDRTDDDAIAFIEDFTDTMNDVQRRIDDSGDWEKKYRENDEAWREKYRARFFGGETPDEPGETIVEKRSYDDLFEVK